MATTTVHAQLIKYAANGDQTILYLENKGEDVKISRASNTNVPASVTTVQELVNALGSLAFSDGITVSNLGTGNFASGVITTDLTVSASGKIADARALKTLNDKIATNTNSITTLNGNYAKLKDKAMNVTLLSSGWSGDEAPYSQNISVGEEYVDPRVFEIVQSPDCTKEEFLAFSSMGGGIGTLSGGVLTIKIYGKKPTIDIPTILIVRGDA